MKRQKILGVVLAAVFAIGCGLKGPIHYKIAHIGAEAATVAEKAQLTVVEADKTGLLKEKDVTRKAMDAFDKLAVQLDKLATALVVFDALAPAAQDQEVPKLEELLDEARRLVRVALTFVPGETPTGEELLKLFDNMEAAFNQIQRGLRPLPTPGV